MHGRTLAETLEKQYSGNRPLWAPSGYSKSLSRAHFCTVSPLGLGTLLEFQNHRASTKRSSEVLFCGIRTCTRPKRSCLIVRDKRSQWRYISLHCNVHDVCIYTIPQCKTRCLESIKKSRKHAPHLYSWMKATYVTVRDCRSFSLSINRHFH